MGINPDVLCRLPSRAFLEHSYFYPELRDSSADRALVPYPLHLSPTMALVYETGGAYRILQMAFCLVLFMLGWVNLLDFPSQSFFARISPCIQLCANALLYMRSPYTSSSVLQQ